MKCLFLRMQGDVEKPQELLDLVQATNVGRAHANAVIADLEWFRAIPGSPLAYWATDVLLQAFRVHAPFETDDRTAKHGAATLDDFRFLRCWWEVAEENLYQRDYVPFAKGGNATPFFVQIPLTINWKANGAEVKAYVAAKVGSASRTIQAEGFYFRPGITWPLRASRFSPQVLPEGCIFSLRSSSAFVPRKELARTLALLSSSVVDAMLKLSLGRLGHPEFTVGVIQRLPWPQITPQESTTLSELGRNAWLAARGFYIGDEASHAFLLPCAVHARSGQSDRKTIHDKRQLAVLQKQVEAAACALYDVGPNDLTALEASLNHSALVDSNESGANNEEDASEDEEPIDDVVDTVGSWLTGGVFGRFDPRLAAGERPIPAEPEPFDPLPSRSPGMYPEGEEPADRHDILVDDEGHPDDLAARAQAVAERVKVDVPENLRGWLARDFFSLHIKMYSKSRRKAPIYWQLATPSASYSVWLYIHAFSKDTLFRLQNDYVAPKLAHEERRLATLTTELRDGATAVQRKELAAQEALVEELRAFLAEVKRVAPLWKPNLDDGVIINFAPLWRLVPQHKAWQKELKSTWDALCEGEYDWAHLAMHLWPERVVPRCATDRSLAIAHGLETDFWEEGANGKWQPRKVAQSRIDELIAERTSAAVKDALRALLDAPAPVASRSGGRGPSRRGSTRRARSGGSTGPAVPSSPDSTTLEAVKRAIAEGIGGVSKSDVLAATGLTDAQWNAAINALLTDGSVTKIGAGRGTRYQRMAST